MMQATATIFALSSGAGRAGIAVIRVSGPQAGAVLGLMAAPRPKPRYAALRSIIHPRTGALLDMALALWFPAPRSETGEDMAELQIHGGNAVIRAVLAALGQVAGCRLAEPGEFARRAFENGRLDLTAAEGLADLVDAETEAQREQALAQAGGSLAQRYVGWRERLLQARGLTEAAIDFSDEGDVAADAIDRAEAVVRDLLAEMTAHLDDRHRGELIREGVRVVLAGPPNVGKSSLLNALARRDVAIVSAEAGTTRDVVEVKLDLGGYAVVLSDTAGIREPTGPVEQEGIRRTLDRTRSADLVLWISDASNDGSDASARRALPTAPVLRVINKIDLRSDADMPIPGDDEVRVSALTGAGIDTLTRRLAKEAAARIGQRPVAPLTQLRHRLAVEAAHRSLSSFLDDNSAGIELRAEHLRLAADDLGRVVGLIGVEDVLGHIFGRFCIGK